MSRVSRQYAVTIYVSYDIDEDEDEVKKALERGMREFTSEELAMHTGLDIVELDGVVVTTVPTSIDDRLLVDEKRTD